MNATVRYYSRSGNTKAVAEAIAGAAGVEAVSVDAPEASLKGHVDVLFIGGALYAYGIDAHLRSYIASLDASLVGKAVAFSTSWVSKHAIALIKDALEERGVSVAPETLYFRGRPSGSQLADAEKLVRKLL